MYDNSQVLKDITSSVPNHQSAWEDMISDLTRKGSSFSSQELRDSKPNGAVKTILANWEKFKGKSDLFIKSNLVIQEPILSKYKEKSKQSAKEYCENIWQHLNRGIDKSKWSGSRIALPKPYYVSSETAQDVTYWESYFTILGLVAAQKKQAAIDMVDNFAYLLEKFGLIPSQSRYYSLSSSQPPYFSLMVAVIVNKGWANWSDYALALRREYQFWMEGADVEAADGFAYRRVVKVKGYVLNRYWDDKSDKKHRILEHHSDLLDVAKKSGISDEEIIEHLCSASESGWDVSSRWMSKPLDSSSIKTAHIIPIELNALLSHLEFALGRAFPAEKNQWSARVRERRSALNTLFWNGETYTDIDLDGMGRSEHLSAATFYPLWIGAPGVKQVDRVLEILEVNYLTKGGVVTSLSDTGQEWDFPNVSPSIQWACIVGAHRCGNIVLANKIAQSFVHNCDMFFEKNKNFLKTYNSDINNNSNDTSEQGYACSIGVYLGCVEFIETGNIIG